MLFLRLSYGLLFLALSVPMAPAQVSTRDSGHPLLLTGTVMFTGEIALPEVDLRTAMDIRRGEPFSEAVLKRDIDRLLALYDRRGYPFAVVRVADIRIRYDDADTAAGNAASIDPASPDAASIDPASPDAASPDPASPDAASPDAASPDAASPDPASPDPASPDPASPDAASPDAASPDAASPDPASPDAASPDAAVPDTVSADIVLAIESGDLFRIDEFTVEGNALTRTNVIVRETRIDRGEVYDAEKVGDVRRRLARLDFFSNVDEPRLYVRDGQGGLLLRVSEGSTNLFDGVVGYQPPAGEEEEGYFTGLVNLGFRNLFGTGRRLDARWERATREVSELELHYLEPWLFGYPINLTGGFFQRQQDSAYVRRALDGEIRFLATTDLQFAATVQSTQVIPSQNSVIPALTRSSTLAGGVELRIDTRDDIWNPRAGIILRNSYSGGDKRFTNAAGEEVTDFLQRIEIDAGYFHALFARTVLAVRLQGRELRGDELDISDFYRVGGANTLRGYREEQFTGTRFGWMNSELRYSLGRRTFAFIFYDFGYIYQSPDADRGREEFSAFRGGYGIGGRIETALGIMGVSYALGQGDGFADGKIHFGLINAF